MKLRALIPTLGIIVACGPSDPAPSASTLGALPDLGWPLPGADAARPDGGTLDDGGPVGDGGAVSSPDGGAGMDAGPEAPDQDGDRISDVHEGRGRVDTDGDGVPDSLDLDSDDDGIPDAVEAGDESLTTPPTDTDRDLVPDYRDLDSDGDGIADAIEGAGDFDFDGIADFRDLDADGDAIPDSVEGDADQDGDGAANFRDLDSDNDTIPDLTEGADDIDGDLVPSFLDLDADGDGLSDTNEGVEDIDGDGVPAFLDTDTDGDGVPDLIETDADFDADGVPNYLDLDADGDTISDRFEGALDFDGDGAPSFMDLDSDADGIPDQIEGATTALEDPPVDTDADGAPDFVDLDSDADFIPDATEGLADDDGDGLPRYVDLDSDADGLLDREEAGDDDLSTPPVMTDGDALPDYLDLDSDEDGILDLDEGRADSDQDGVPDRISLDSDGDGFTDAVEAGDLDSSTPPVDTDRDGVADYRDFDSDDDGLGDDVELGCVAGSSERLSIDSDGDSYQDTAERAVGSDPCDPASRIEAFYFVLPASGAQDSDFLVFDDTEVDEADIVLNVDTTGSMGGEITNLRNSLSTIIVPGVELVIDSPAFSVSSFQDFPRLPYGSLGAGDLPYSLEQRVTTDSTEVQSALNALSIRNGQDTRESGLEALYQVATGDGVTWTGGSVPAFDPNLDRVAGVADGTGGGVGLRSDALPVVVHVTDAPSHLGSDYGVNMSAHEAADVRQSLVDAGIRVITITGEDQPRPWSEAQLRSRFDDYCAGLSEPTLGEIADPQGADTDWFELSGAMVGDVVDVRVEAFEVGSALDPMVAVYDNTGAQLALDDNDAANGVDAELSLTLAGTPPFYVAVSAFNDADFNGSGAVSAGHYFIEIEVDGVEYAPASIECSRVDAGDSRGAASLLSPRSMSAMPASASACADTCWEIVEFEELRAPYGLARSTNAQVPACAWDEFGAARPIGCAANQCCTGLNGAGVPEDDAGACPLSFEISGNGSGIDQALVTGIEALVNFSEFTISTRVRADPAELPGVDTSCFIQRVTPVLGTAPNTCAPTPSAVDTSTLTVGLDTFEGVVPGSVLEFEVVAANTSPGGRPCAAASQNFQVFRAFIDVIADDVAQLSTRDVVIVVPPGQPPGGN